MFATRFWPAGISRTNAASVLRPDTIGFMLLGCAAALAGCNQQNAGNSARELVEQVDPHVGGDGAPANSFGFLEAMDSGPNLFGEKDLPARALTVAAPAADDGLAGAQMAAAVAAKPDQQIAYSYGFGFQINSKSIAKLQQAHIKMCEGMKSNCRVIRVSQASTDSWNGYGELELEVASTNAVIFGSDLSKPAEELGGKLVSSVRDGEDLSEQIIDSEARLSSRLVLREKLTNILRANRGSVDELVKAEQAVADVNESIDATRSKLKILQNRVQFSAVRIEYEPYFGEAQLGFGRPVMTAIRSVGTTLGTSIAVLIYLMTALVPVMALILAIRWVLHRFGLRLRFWRRRNKSSE